jgi:Chaperone of endosialidase
MNPLIQLKTTPPLLITLALLCFGLLPGAQAVDPPPDGGYAGFNTAGGTDALFSNTTGTRNTGLGYQALYYNHGDYNTATGSHALFSNTSGTENTATGASALSFNTSGFDNTGIGVGALGENRTGHNNTALGAGAGIRVITANNVICIGSEVEGRNVSNTTWIGSVYGGFTHNATTAPVIVSADGQLGTVASSKRFKKDITTMEKASEAILSLRPVTFHYKTDTKGTPQFGLIAEEVAKVTPALVLPDNEGKPYTVRYEAVNAMLLNEFLKEHRRVEQMEKQIEALTAGLQRVSAQVELSKAAPQTVLNSQ